MTNTNHEITDKRIEQLATNAGSAGDLVQVALCRVALGWTPVDFVECREGLAWEELVAWGHPWKSQIVAAASGANNGGRQLARTLCERVIAESDGE